MNRRFASLIPLFILFSGGLAGCLSLGGHDAECIEIEFPGPGSEFHRLTHYENPADGIPPQINSSFSAVATDRVKGGDGYDYQVVRVESGLNTDYVSIETGDIVRSDFGVGGFVSLRPNDAVTMGNVFFGRCLATGDSWTSPHYSPPEGSEVTILHASNEKVHANIVQGPWERAIYGNGSVPGHAYEFIWYESRAFPDIYKNHRVSDNGSLELRSTTELVDQAVVPLEVKPTSTLEPVGQLQPVQRWPEMTHPESESAYRDFISEVESRGEVTEYLDRHPRAYASWIVWEEVNERESHATVWTALLRDDSDEAMLVEWVYRCFENMTHRLIYGDCHYSDEYIGPGSFNQDENPVTSVSPMALPANLSSVPLTSILKIAKRLVPNESPARIEWRAHPWDVGEFRFGAATGRPGWVLWYGDIQGEMIVTSEGPRGSSGAYQTDLWHFYYDAIGWALSRPFLSEDGPGDPSQDS